MGRHANRKSSRENRWDTQGGVGGWLYLSAHLYFSFLDVERGLRHLSSPLVFPSVQLGFQPGGTQRGKQRREEESWGGSWEYGGKCGGVGGRRGWGWHAFLWKPPAVKDPRSEGRWAPSPQQTGCCRIALNRTSECERTAFWNKSERRPGPACNEKKMDAQITRVFKVKHNTKYTIPIHHRPFSEQETENRTLCRSRDAKSSTQIYPQFTAGTSALCHRLCFLYQQTPLWSWGDEGITAVIRWNDAFCRERISITLQKTKRVQGRMWSNDRHVIRATAGKN